MAGPFSWANQGCWIGYFATTALTVVLVSWNIVIWPVRELSTLNKVRHPSALSGRREEGEGARASSALLGGL